MIEKTQRNETEEASILIQHNPSKEKLATITVNEDGSALGSVHISEPSGARITRRLNGHSCAEVADALARMPSVPGSIPAELARWRERALTGELLTADGFR